MNARMKSLVDIDDAIRSQKYDPCLIFEEP